MGTPENSPAIHCRDNNSRMPESHRDGRMHRIGMLGERNLKYAKPFREYVGEWREVMGEN